MTLTVKSVTHNRTRTVTTQVKQCRTKQSIVVGVALFQLDLEEEEREEDREEGGVRRKSICKVEEEDRY